jgi:hypothetical protein
MANGKTNPAIAKLIRTLKKELAALEAGTGPQPSEPRVKDEYRFDIRVAPGKKPKVVYHAMTVVTIGCPTVAGTCMVDSCYTC